MYSHLHIPTINCTKEVKESFSLKCGLVNPFVSNDMYICMYICHMALSYSRLCIL